MNMQVSRDKEGYLIDPDDWTENIATELAREEGVELNDDHWPVINYMRSYFSENGIIPDVRHVVSFMSDNFGYPKKEAKNVIFRLFPYGYVKQACKISGMKRPRAWSTG